MLYGCQAAVASAGVLVLALSVSANAQLEDWTRKSVIQLTSRSEVPGMVLEPGTYVFKLLDVDDHRKIVEVLDKDGQKRLTAFTAVLIHRDRPEFDTNVSFYENVTKGPKPLRTWYWDNELHGYEFVYSTRRAKELAKGADDYVMASDSRNGAINAITADGTKVPILDARSNVKTPAIGIH